MKKTNLFTLLLLSSHILFAQETYSTLLPLQDTQTFQTCYSSFSSDPDDGFYLVGHYLTYAPDDFNSGLTLFKFSKNQNLEWKKDILPDSNRALLQMLSHHPFIATDTFSLLSNSYKTIPEFEEYSSLRCFTTEGILKWEKDIVIPQSFSSNLLLRFSDADDFGLIGLGLPISDVFWPGMVLRFDRDGNFSDTVEYHLPLPASVIREYSFIENAVVVGTDIVAQVTCVEYDDNSYRGGKILVSIANDGTINWLKEYWNNEGLELKSFDYNSVSQQLCLSLASTFGYCIKLFDTQGSEVNEICENGEAGLSVFRFFTGGDSFIYFLGESYYGLPFLGKINQNAEMVWKRYFKENTLGDQYAGGFTNGSIAPNGNILLSGALNDAAVTDPFDQHSYYWILLLQDSGCLATDCIDTLLISSSIVGTSTNAVSNNVSEVLIYPNPVDNLCRLELPAEVGEITDPILEVSNSQGTLVYSAAIETNSFVKGLEVNTLYWDPGVYFVSIFSLRSGKKISGKFIKIR